MKARFSRMVYSVSVNLCTTFYITKDCPEPLIFSAGFQNFLFFILLEFCLLYLINKAPKTGKTARGLY
jgi:hypothetical protein